MAALISRDDFHRIRASLALALAMIVGGAGVVGASTLLLQAEWEAHRAAQAKRAEIQGRLAHVRSEEREIKQTIARFNELAGRGVFGEEARLDWVERIREIGKARRLFHIRYEFSPEHPLGPEAAPATSRAYDFRASTMKLQMQLLHEADLLGFLSDLRTAVAAYIRLRECTVARLSQDAGAAGTLAPQLKADCTIDWIIVRETKPA